MRIVPAGADAQGSATASGAAALPPLLGHSRIIGAIQAVPDGTLTEANDTFLRMAVRSREELERGELQWGALFHASGAQTHPDGAWEADLLQPDGSSLAVLVEVIRGEGRYTAFVLDRSTARVAELALTRAREVLEERSQQLFGVAEKLSESEMALAAADRHHRSATADLESERRRVEELAERLANANRELDAFSYSVSHDLRAPLRTIDGFSRVLLSNYAAQLDDRGRDYLQRVRNATQRMSRLLDDLLQLARTNRLAMSFATVNLSAGAEQIAADLQQTAPERSVTWKIQPGLTVRGDRTLLRVLLENLLGNAWKFTSRRDHAVIEFGCDTSSGTRVFFVRDNGAGFDMTYADQLFGVFQRLHTADEFEGTGIGLATVQRVVQRHGGTVHAEGAVGQGATFYFTLGENE